MDCEPTGSSVHGGSPDKNTRVGCHTLLQGIFATQGSNPGIEPRSPALQVDSLPTEPPVKPKNTGAGSLSLLQGIFLTQELNRGLLHCRQILYQLSYQERHIIGMYLFKLMGSYNYKLCFSFLVVRKRNSASHNQ